MALFTASQFSGVSYDLPEGGGAPSSCFVEPTKEKTEYLIFYDNFYLIQKISVIVVICKSNQSKI